MEKLGKTVMLAAAGLLALILLIQLFFGYRFSIVQFNISMGFGIILLFIGFVIWGLVHKSALKFLAVFLITAILVLPAVWWFSAATYSARNKEAIEKTNNPSVDDVCAAAFAGVKASLKAPSTAKFPYQSDACAVKDLGNKRWQVSSFVDAQNSFGAMLRTHFTVVIEDRGDDDWRLIDIKTNP